ncbi:MAG: Hsp70 family protein, partial [Nannocystaceae bacterium]|nr:Hsp70 family protein [Nannocystaceae bacterium]
MSESFVVGIDLGTTHCAVAAASLSHPAVHQLDVPQLIAPGEVGLHALLPSFMYLPAAGELPEHERMLPWGADTQIVGELARRLGAKAPNRLVASAKSWVCHGGVNRRAPILPWSAPDDEPHVSPFEAQVAYLAHLRQAWLQRYPNAPLAEQDVIVTVPASFDEGARELTTQAAAEAGLGEVRLLEEPQAAFYDFLGAHVDDLGEQLGDARLILVVDVGGGTTDLTLLEVQPPQDAGEQPKIERIAVGGHLMLGGDNMDAALAVYALEKAGLQRPSDATIWSALVQSARQAKEDLLAADAPKEAIISYVGRGSRLVGNTKSIVIERDEASRVLLDGFVPVTAADETAQRASRAGLTTLGLPYTTDTAIGRHINAFLRRHADAAEQAGATVVDGLPRPDLLLLNGGVFNAPAIITRLTDVIARWFGDSSIRLLEHTSLETAVARGAVRSGLARRGIGEVIGGGTARAYYIGVEGPDGSPQAMCVAPRAMDEGASVSVPDRVYELVLDQPVSFPLFAYTGDRADAAGDLVAIGEDDDLDAMPAIETVLRSKGEATQRGGTVPVTLTATLTQTGALELYLVTVELPPRRWRLDFVLHATAPPTESGEKTSQPGTDKPAPEVTRAAEIFAEAYTSDDPKAVKSVRKDIEKVLGPRGQWSAATCRALWQVCMDHERQRGRSELHEINWLRLVSWCLRPGFGAAGDEARMATMWTLRDAGLAKRTKATWAEWWIAWRRIAAGLDAEHQRSL